jgi:hypothetical protein
MEVELVEGGEPAFNDEDFEEDDVGPGDTDDGGEEHDEG